MHPGGEMVVCYGLQRLGAHTNPWRAAGLRMGLCMFLPLPPPSLNQQEHTHAPPPPAHPSSRYRVRLDTHTPAGPTCTERLLPACHSSLANGTLPHYGWSYPKNCYCYRCGMGLYIRVVHALGGGEAGGAAVVVVVVVLGGGVQCGGGSMPYRWTERREAWYVHVLWVVVVVQRGGGRGGETACGQPLGMNMAEQGGAGHADRRMTTKTTVPARTPANAAAAVHRRNPIRSPRALLAMPRHALPGPRGLLAHDDAAHAPSSSARTLTLAVRAKGAPT